MIVRIQSANRSHAHSVYSVTHDSAHTNVAYMFREDKRREPKKDTLTVIRGYAGSYPNFVFDVPPGELSDWVDAMLEAKEQMPNLVERWGVRRTSPQFWREGSAAGSTSSDAMPASSSSPRSSSAQRPAATRP
jgi:hypothetical protein